MKGDSLYKLGKAPGEKMEKKLVFCQTMGESPRVVKTKLLFWGLKKGQNALK